MASSSQQQLIPPPTQINDTHKVYSVATACIVLGAIASLFVVARLGQRAYSRTFSNDDWAIIPGLLFYIGWIAMAGYVNLNAGVGKPLWEITLGEYSVWFKGIIGSAWLYPAMTASIRISILLFYRRMFATSKGYMRYIIWFLLAMQVIYLIIFSILPAFICRPLYMAWHPLERQEYFNDWYYYYSQVALYSASMAFDTFLLFLPLYPLWKLQMPVRKRLGVITIFVLGAGASITAAYKLAIFVTQMQRYTDINPEWLQYEMSMLIPPQFDKYGTTFWIPSTIEPTVALIGTSLPALRHFIVTTVRDITMSNSIKGSKISSLTNKSNQPISMPTKQKRRTLSESELALSSLEGDYYELNDNSKVFGK